MSLRNRLGNCHNMYQGGSKRVLTVCSAGLLRSPTTAWVLSNAPWNFNTRACGYNDEYALIILDDVLVEWADEIVVMDQRQEAIVYGMLKQSTRPEKPVHVLNIPDNYGFREPELVEIIKEKLQEIFPLGDEPTGEYIPEEI